MNGTTPSMNVGHKDGVEASASKVGVNGQNIYGQDVRLLQLSRWRLVVCYGLMVSSTLRVVSLAMSYMLFLVHTCFSWCCASLLLAPDKVPDAALAHKSHAGIFRPNEYHPRH